MQMKMLKRARDTTVEDALHLFFNEPARTARRALGPALDDAAGRNDALDDLLANAQRRRQRMAQQMQEQGGNSTRELGAGPHGMEQPHISDDHDQHNDFLLARERRYGGRMRQQLHRGAGGRLGELGAGALGTDMQSSGDDDGSKGEDM